VPARLFPRSPWRPFALIDARSIAWAGLFSLVIAAWLGLFLTAPAVDGGAVFGALDWRHSAALHDGIEGPRLMGMWALMVLAMMLPTLVPMVRTYLELTHAQPRRLAMQGAFVLGYVLVWLGFSALATFAQVVLQRAGLLDAGGVLMSMWLTLGLLIFAGLYQFSALKQACVRACQAPFQFFMAHWRDGVLGGLNLGLRQGLICLGCCWAMMVLAFVGGTMNLVWMGGATVLMALEKLPSIGARVSPLLGCGLLALALALFVSLIYQQVIGGVYGLAY